MTLEQEASYEKQLDAMPATPDWILGLRRDSLYKGSLESASEETQAVPIVKPSTTKVLMMHIQDEPAQFAAISRPLLATEIQDKTLIPHVPTATLQAPKQNSGSLRHVNITDPYLPSARTTPNHEFAVVPRRETAQLPPRLGDDTADAPEHMTAVETLINAKIAEFHVNEQRLPHRIKVSFIRYAQNWMNTRNYKHFNYKGVPIPITGAAIGEFAVDEVRLD